MAVGDCFDRVGVKCKSLCLFGDFVYIIRVRVSDGNDGMTTVEVEIFIPFCIVSITAFPRFYFYIEQGIYVEKFHIFLLKSRWF